MVTYLGAKSVTGVKDKANPLGTGFWTCAFTPERVGVRVPYHVYHIAISGPVGSSFQVYVDTTFYDYVARGDINSWDPSQPMVVYPGQTVSFYWNTAAGSAPQVSMHCSTA